MRNPFAEEAKKRWGVTEAHKQSQERVKKMTKADFTLIQKEGDILMAEITAHMGEGARSPKIQELIGAHYSDLRHFYEPNLELYRNLANLYAEDKRFSAYFEKYAPGLAHFMRDAMIAYCITKANP